MKKQLLFLFIHILSIHVFSQKVERKIEDYRIEASVKILTDSLQLSTEQATQLQEVELRYTAKILEQVKATTNYKEINLTVQKLVEEKDLAIHKILNEQQYKLYSAMMERRKQKILLEREKNRNKNVKPKAGN